MPRPIRWLLTLSLLLAIAGCGGSGAPEETAEPVEPAEQGDDTLSTTSEVDVPDDADSGAYDASTAAGMSDPGQPPIEGGVPTEAGGDSDIDIDPGLPSLEPPSDLDAGPSGSATSPDDEDSDEGGDASVPVDPEPAEPDNG